MKANIHFTLRGVQTNKEIEVPNTYNPVEVENWNELLDVLKENIPDNENLKTTVLRIEIEND